VWRRWGDEYVVYNPLSGDSHLLDFVSAQGLLHLAEHEISAEDLEDELSTALGISADEDLVRYVERITTEFAELGLTRPAQS
jgi:PqqD family protein of HPr-rel-A system